MGASLLENELLQYWPRLTIVQQESILSVIKSIVQQEAEIDIEQYNRDIDEAMKRINEGKFITQEDLEKESFPLFGMKKPEPISKELFLI